MICPDNRGVGESARGVQEVTIGSMATDLVSVLDDLKIEHVDVAGWSMGGFIAQKLVAWISRACRSAWKPTTPPSRCTASWASSPQATTTAH